MALTGSISDVLQCCKNARLCRGLHPSSPPRPQARLPGNGMSLVSAMATVWAPEIPAQDRSATPVHLFKGVHALADRGKLVCAQHRE